MLVRYVVIRLKLFSLAEAAAP